MKVKELSFLVILCCGIASCESGPQYKTFEVISDGAKSCIADAKEAEIACRAKQLPLYQSCMNEKASLEMQAASLKLSTIQAAQARLDQCMNSCLQETHVNSYNKEEKNDALYCTSYRGSCSDVESALMKAEKEDIELGGASCGDVYDVCNQDYALTFDRCGGQHETRCVENCDVKK